jgi:hypothetical protein
LAEQSRAATVKIGAVHDTSEGTTTLVRRWLALRDEKDAMEDQLKEIKEDLATLAEQVLQSFTQDGTSRVSVDGMTVHVISDLKISAKGGDYDRAVQVLRDVGLGGIVREQFSPQTLKAVVKEIMTQSDMGNEQAQKQIRALEESFTIFELYSLSARKAAQSKSGDRFINQKES